MILMTSMHQHMSHPNRAGQKLGSPATETNWQAVARKSACLPIYSRVGWDWIIVMVFIVVYSSWSKKCMVSSTTTNKYYSSVNNKFPYFVLRRRVFISYVITRLKLREGQVALPAPAAVREGGSDNEVAS